MKIKLSLFPYQSKAFFSPKRFAILGSGTGAGKTWLLAVWLVTKALTNEGRIILALGPTLKHLKRGLWNEYILKFLRRKRPYFHVKNPNYDPLDPNSLKHIDLVFHELVEGDDWILNKSDTTIYFPHTGCIIYGAGFNEPDSFQGQHAVAIGPDEIGLASDDAMDTIIQRMDYDLSNQLLGATTPYSWGAFKVNMYDPWEEARINGTLDECDIEYIKVRSIDNPYYSKENYEKARMRLPAWKFDMRYNGEFTKPLGIVYEEVPYVAPFPIPDDWYISGGVDFGFNNPSAIIWIAENLQTDESYIFDEYIKSGMTLDDIEYQLKLRSCIYYGDSSAAGDIATLYSHGIDIRPAPKEAGSVNAGIRLVDSEFRTKKLMVFDTCTDLKSELLQYSYKLDANKDPTDIITKSRDHGCDATRYNRYSKRSVTGNPEYYSVGSKRYSVEITNRFLRNR